MELPKDFVDDLEDQLGDEFRYPKDAAPILHEDSPEFDYVVVGAGASGATVASRLAQAFPSDKVLLVESGGDPPITSEIPALWHTLWQVGLAWVYPCEQRTDLTFDGLRGRRPVIFRGKCLGGTSSINGLPYLRGHPSDYDSWQIPGWTFDDVLPFFKKSEDMRDDTVLTTNPEWHGTGGELTVEAATSVDPMKDVIKNAALEMDCDVVIDLNGPPNHCLGFGDVHRTQRHGVRCSSAKAFLSLTSGEKDNLLIARQSTAIKINFDGNRAIGIGVLHDGTSLDVSVRKEVVLAAGAIGSPQLLLLSGVGPKEHLHEIGIPLVMDLPVGTSFYDQAIFHVLVLSVPSAREEKLSDPFQDFLSERKGPLSTIGLMELMGFIKTASTEKWPHPSVQFNHARYPKGKFASKLLSAEIEQAIQNINKDTDIVIMMVFLLQPKKSGRLGLASGDPRELPVIESGLLTDPRDMTILLEAVRFVEKMAKGRSFSEAGVCLRYIDFPGAGDLVPGSQSYWEYAIRRLTSSAFHPVASCPIGEVVDSRLKVKGISNIRVADASAIPKPISVNPNVPAIMIAERAAHFILEDQR